MKRSWATWLTTRFNEIGQRRGRYNRINAPSQVYVDVFRGCPYAPYSPRIEPTSAVEPNHNAKSMNGEVNEGIENERRLPSILAVIETCTPYSGSISITSPSAEEVGRDRHSGNPGNAQAEDVGLTIGVGNGAEIAVKLSSYMGGILVLVVGLEGWLLYASNYCRGRRIDLG
ncbi:hypothetical protein BDQ17DRAFT_1426564 [Cyathus striatus]|nr:hypothetical protein BDQ17DRAFT_1426564 [Cyathus striatus]